MNPYASFLGDQNAAEVIAATPSELETVVAAIGTSGLDRSAAPGKWSPREILAHLADCEIMFAERLRQTIAEDRHVIQPFDQDKFALQYKGYEARMALSVFTAVRRWNLAFLDTVPPESAKKTVNHPERGDMMFQTIVETMAGHDLNHLQQLRAMSH